MSLFAPYIPIDRRFALAEARELPDRATGTVLFADLSGFTQLSSRLVEALGRKRGAEELLPLLNRIYSNIVRVIHTYHGSVINFSGDAVTCWFETDLGARALTAAVEMQSDMAAFQAVSITGGFTASISMKVSISCGDVRRFLVGSPRHAISDVLAGSLVDEVAEGERLAQRGEILVSESIAAHLGAKVRISEWREGKEGHRFGLLEALLAQAQKDPWPPVPDIRDAVAAQFVLPSVAARLRKGKGHYLAEIRPATALFVQFSGLDYDGEDAAGEKLNRYVRWVQEVIEQYAGVLLQLTIGDKGAYFFIGFGAPIAHADDALRAVASAMILRDVPEALGFIREVKIGLAQGQMRTGAYGGEHRLAYGVLGDKVNRAAKLMGFADPGEIYCDESLYLAIQNHWETELVPMRPMESARGSTFPVGAIYRLTGVPIQAHSEERVRQAFVGRQEELATLKSKLLGALDGQPGAAWVSGEAGIGKSHLIHELVEEARENGFLVLEGAGSGIEQQTAYWAWRSVLAQYFGWREIKSDRSRIRLVQSVVEYLTPENHARMPVLNDVAYLGIPENELTRTLPRQLRLDNVVLLVAELLRIRSQQQPVLLVMEDVHWMDDLSWELSYRVARQLIENRERVSVIWSTRPGRQSGLWSRDDDVHKLPAHQTVVLEEMPVEDIRRLISLELGTAVENVPGVIESLVIERSEGNPFYTRELVKTLKERRLIWYLGADAVNPWQVADDFSLAASTLPDTLQGLILTRIDRLSLDQQSILKVASVIGRSFDAHSLGFALKGFAAAAANGLLRHLEALCRADLVHREDESAYSFNHVLTRDTTYQTLLYAQRRDLHGAVAAWYEEEYRGELRAPHYPTLAYHYRHAEQPEIEYGYVCLSAEQARLRYANREAIEYLTRALALVETNEQRYEIHLQREEIYSLVGDRDHQYAELQQLDVLCQSAESDAWRAELSERFTQYYRLIGKYEEAMRMARRLVEIGALLGDGLRTARGTHLQGQILVQQGHYAEAAKNFDLALPAYQCESAKTGIAEVYGDYGVLEVYKGDFKAAIPYFEAAIANYQSMNNRRETARNQMNLAGAHGYLGEIEQTIANYREAYEINREIGERRNAHIAQGNLGAAYLDSGDYGLALQNLNEALLTSRAIGDLRKEGTWLGIMGELYLEIGRLDEAIAHFQRALDISTEIGNKNGQGMWINRLADADRLAGALAASRSWIEKGLDLNERIGNRSELARVQTCLGLLCLDEGQWNEAVNAFTTAYAIWDSLEHPSEKQNVLPPLALAYWKQNQAPEAFRRLDEFWNMWANSTEQQRSDVQASALLAAIKVFEAAADPRKVQLLHSAYRLLMYRADKISDPEMRSEFLERVRANRSVRELHEKH